MYLSSALRCELAERGAEVQLERADELTKQRDQLQARVEVS